MGALVLYFDGARGLAFVLLPMIFANTTISDMGMTWKHHFRLKLIATIAVTTYGIVGMSILLQVISIEQGDPIIKNGILFDITQAMAGDPSQDQPPKAGNP
ncbi:hypothetical protein BFV94_4515 [Alteromonas macleodii]|uniref:Uncharacterized protein n=2 Tax=Alteromonas macleodii TaxID=28108 RepID=A0AB36FL03_ALTMA|nr:hypothetical protein BFV93_4732 [Alteromonas macleodii]OES24766.1 hypothetical protein BFV95_4525 [Alteromonas macleodii]OES25044.1 hypothetical protein BFV94_4515 [Alteromonas macleodii]OES39087.1 hypothetical protein BFV96_4235 [Alteromonas macleodii]